MKTQIISPWAEQNTLKNSTYASMQYAYRDALSLPETAGLLDEDSPAACVLIEPPGITRSFKREQPEFLDDPDKVGLFSQLEPGVFYSPPPFIVKAKHLRIVGFRTVLSHEGIFFNDDSIAAEPQQTEYLGPLSSELINEETGLRRLDSSESFVLDPRGRSIEQVPGTTVLLSSAEPSNYGSWLFRLLPKLQTLRRFRLADSANFLVWAVTPAFREYLRILGVAEKRIIQHDPQNVIYELENAVVPSIRNNQAFLDAESVSFYSELRLKFGEKQQPGSRIYVSRLAQSQHGSPRAMRNEVELIARLRAIGFRIVSPENLSVLDQIRAFSSAEMVVGPSGSGMFNVVFCHPGTKVIDIESEPHWIHAHICLFSSCNLRFGIFVGKAADKNFTVHHKAWSVNIEELMDRIEAFSVA